MSKRPTVLMILDGYGLNPRKDHNAIAEANTPVMVTARSGTTTRPPCMKPPT